MIINQVGGGSGADYEKTGIQVVYPDINVGSFSVTTSSSASSNSYRYVENNSNVTVDEDTADVVAVAYSISDALLSMNNYNPNGISSSINASIANAIVGYKVISTSPLSGSYFSCALIFGISDGTWRDKLQGFLALKCYVDSDYEMAGDYYVYTVTSATASQFYKSGTSSKTYTGHVTYGGGKSCYLVKDVNYYGGGELTDYCAMTVPLQGAVA